jgi:hypothetical protein
MVRASPSPLLSTRVCAQMVPHTSIQKASTDHATPSYRSFGKSAKSLVPTQRGCLAAQRLHASPLRCHFTSMCRIELPRIYTPSPQCAWQVVSPRNDFTCAFVPVNTKPQTVNSRLAWALFSTTLCCKPGLETRSYDRLASVDGHNGDSLTYEPA